MNETVHDKPGPGKRSGKPQGGRPQRGPGGHGGRPGGHGGGGRGHGGPGGHSARGDSAGRGPGRGGKPMGGKKKLLPQQIKIAKQMVEQSGIPFNAAVRVVLGKTTLNDVLQEMLREEKIKKLIETYNINRALATNIALGRTDLEIVLLRRRKNQTLQEHYTQSCLDEARAKNHHIALALHGHKKVLGHITEVGKYTIFFMEDGQKEPTEIHKTAIKFAYDPEQFKQLRKFTGVDNKVKGMSLQPILRAKERFHFKNLSLQQSIDDKKEVDVITLEGDTFRGQVEWFGRWEFGLKFKGGVRVTVFRHAVYSLKLLDTH